VPRLNRESKNDIATLQHIDNFAKKGYRTLVYGKRRIDETMILKLKTDENFDLSELECDLELLGVTGVEDVL
jgi:magnesium-transporting ATPase (P-type)